MTNNPNSKRVPVLMGNRTNKYQLFESANGKAEIWAKFRKWNSKASSAGKLKITNNTIDRGRVFEVRLVNQDSCKSEEGICKELQILVKDGESNTGSFKINNSQKFDFKDVKVVIVEFNQTEIDNETYLNYECSNCYDDIDQPETSQGNVILGGD